MTTWVPGGPRQRFAEFIPSTLTAPFMKPVEIGDWLTQNAPDAFTGATPLALMKFEQIPADPELMLGTTAGSVGETSALLILLGGLYLVARNMMNWQITFSILGLRPSSPEFSTSLIPPSIPAPFSPSVPGA
jgi:electron transport complex protein RnfD